MDYNRITQRVLLGSIPVDPLHLAILRHEGVGQVVSVCTERDPASLFDGSGIAQRFIPIFEDSPAPHALKAAILAVEAALAAGPGHSVYLHCWLGINRSATVMAGLVLWQERCTVSEALDAIRRLRRGVVRHGAVVEALNAVLCDNPAFGRPARSAEAPILGRLLLPPAR